MKINNKIVLLASKVGFFGILLISFSFALKANLTVLCQILALVIVVSFIGLFGKQGH